MIAIPQLRGRIGRGMPNEPGDVLAGKRLMARIGRLASRPGGFGAGFDRPLEDAITGYQAERRLLVDGVMAPGGETERNIRRDLGLEPKEPPLSPAKLALEGAVGNGAENSTQDLQAVSRALGRLGLFDFDRTAAPPAYITKDLDRAIQTFQRDNDLLQDGLIEPGGETIAALKKVVARRKEEEEEPQEPGRPGKPEKPEAPEGPEEPDEPEGPEKPDADKCKNLWFALRDVNREIGAVRREIERTDLVLRGLEAELARLRGEAVPLPPRPTRPLSRRKSIPRNLTDFLNDIITGTDFSQKFTERRSRIATLVKEIEILKKKLEKLRREEDQLVKIARQLTQQWEEAGCSKRGEDEDDD